MKSLYLLSSVAVAACICPVSAAPQAQGTDLSHLNDQGICDASYRHRSFRPYLPLEQINKTLKIGNYSRYENPTGIFYKAGESAQIEVKGEPRQPLELIIRSFDRNGQESSYPLQTGNNNIRVQNDGLAYINYRDSDPATAPALELNIGGGQVNGIFSSHDTNATWQELLKNAKCNIIDIVGERCQLAYNVDGLRQSCPDQGAEMLGIYDRIIALEHEIMGLDIYGKRPINHIFGRVQWSGFMHADGIGAAYVNSAIPEITDIRSLREHSWGVAHEFGHVNQTRPGMMWAGTQEISNNIYSAWCNYEFNPSQMRLEHELIENWDGKRMRGGRMDNYINNAIVKRQLWQFQGGPDSGIGQVPGHSTGDHFVNVSPLWQLLLFESVVRGDRDFYGRIFEKVRNSNEEKMTQGEMRVQFFKNACDSARLDLSEFFVKTGILAPMNRLVRDYSSHIISISPEMCRAALQHASQYPKPESRVIYYLNANNVDAFKRKLPLQLSGLACPGPAGGCLTVGPELCQNALAYEAYDENGELLRVSLAGLNHKEANVTDVICPQGSACVKAVQWDGKRISLWKKPAP